MTTTQLLFNSTLNNDWLNDKTAQDLMNDSLANDTSNANVMKMHDAAAHVMHMTGTRHGHIVAGVAFIVSGIWSTVFIFKKYFESRYRPGKGYLNRYVTFSFHLSLFGPPETLDLVPASFDFAHIFAAI